MVELSIHYGAIVQVIFLIYFCSRKSSLRLRGNVVYFRILIFSLISLIADLGSIYAIIYSDSLPEFFVMAVCKFYLISLILIAGMCYLYLIVDLNQWGSYQLLWWGGNSFFVLGVLFVGLLPIKKFFDGKQLYTYGPAVLTTYVFCVCYFIAMVAAAIAYRKRMNRRRMVSVFAFIGVMMVAVVIQFFNNYLLLVGFATALGLTVMFAEIENPDFYIDRESGAFSAHALMEFMEELFAKNKTFSGLNITLTAENELLGREEQKILLISVADFLTKYKKSRVFRNVGNEFAVIFEKEEDLYDVLADLEGFLSAPIQTETGEIRVRAKYLIMPDSSLARSANDVFIFRSFLLSLGLESERVVVDEETVKTLKRKEEIRTLVREAIDEERVAVYYQPIYSTQTHKFSSAEALVRILNSDGSIISPGHFIPVAEETGQIVELGEIVFRKVCQFIKEHDIKAMGMEYIEVNLSVAQCEKETLAEDFGRILKEYDVEPGQINLEITETASMEAKEVLLQNMHDFMERGIKFSLDDFGTGQSNLNYIMSMPVDIVKFDYSITRDYFVNARAKYVVENMVNMVQQMGMEVVAEGVETKEQLEEFSSLGVDFIQGYYFSRPIPQDSFCDFIRENNQ